MAALRRKGVGTVVPSLQDHLDRVWRTVLGRPVIMGSAEGLWHPTTDVYEAEGEFVVEVELPGMRGQEVTVSIEENHLIVEGTRRPAQERDAESATYRERPMGDFHRVVHLPPDADPEGCDARYDDGLLVVRLPRREPPKGRKIEIR